MQKHFTNLWQQFSLSLFIIVMLLYIISMIYRSNNSYYIYLLLLCYYIFSIIILLYNFLLIYSIIKRLNPKDNLMANCIGILLMLCSTDRFTSAGAPQIQLYLTCAMTPW